MENTRTPAPVVEWPNKLGFDIGQAEVWKHREAFRVFTYGEFENADRVMLVPYGITTDPAVALAIAETQGLLRHELDEIPYHEAQARFLANVPVQKELF